MKKILFVLIFAVMLLSACGNTSDNIIESSSETTTETTTETTIESTTTKSIEELLQLQVGPAEEFDGITFDMTKNEIIELLGQPDNIVKRNTGTVLAVNCIEYFDKIYFNVSNDLIRYVFDENDVLSRVDYLSFYDESNREQLMKDYESIKEELLKRYPEEICTYFSNEETDLMLDTPNRSVSLSADTELLILMSGIDKIET